jgi:diguanylate cyclase (GGDEF)-like protein
LRDQARTGDAVYRYGGDEFLCLFPEQSIASARIAVERIRGGVEHLGMAHVANPLGILTVSAGLARMDPAVVRPPTAVLKEADEALYRAKELGRNCISDLTTSVV